MKKVIITLLLLSMPAMATTDEDVIAELNKVIEKTESNKKALSDGILTMCKIVNPSVRVRCRKEIKNTVDLIFSEGQRSGEAQERVRLMK